MGIIQDVRSKHPEYNDMSDDALADALHSKFYADMPKEQFREKVGLPANGRQIGRLEAFGRGALQGLTFNTSDEIYAGGRAMLGDDYDTALKEVRGANALAAEQNPGTTLAGEVTGGVIPAVGTAAATMFFPGAAPAATATNAKTAAQAATLAGRAWQGAKIGAPIGAAYGAGAYEGRPDESLADSAMGRIGAGLKGGAVGAATGAILTPVVDAAAGVVRAGTNQVRALTNPEGFAQRKYGEALARSGDAATGFDARQALNDVSRGSPNAIVGDVGGDSVKSLVRTALNRPNAENDNFLKLLHDRQGQQWKEIEANLSKSLGNPDDFGRVSEAIASSRSKDADAAYKAAYEADFNPSKELFDLFKTDEDGKFIRPTVGKLVNTVKNRLQDLHGDDAANLVDNSGLGFVHQIKVEIDHLIGQARKAANRGDASSSDKYDLSALVGLKKQIIDGLEKSQGQAPQLYLNANKQFSNSKALSNALDLGRKESQATEDVIKASLADLQPVEQQYYKLGLSRGLADKNRVGNKMNDRIGRDWRDPQDDFRIDAMMDPQDAGGFRSALEAMEKARDLRRAATGNSTTAKQLMSNADAKQDAEKVLGAVSAVKNAATGNWGALLTQARNATRARIEGISPAVAEEILKIASRPARGVAKSQYIDKMVEQGKALAKAQNLSNAQRDRLILGLIRAADASLSTAVGPTTPN